MDITRVRMIWLVGSVLCDTICHNLWSVTQFRWREQFATGVLPHMRAEIGVT